ncbi:MAG: alpha/beta hydrolase [Roseinatronobacter sp.]
MNRQRLARILGPLSVPSLMFGVLFFAASLTPSLIPRGPVLQGVLGGLVMAIGYLLAQIVGLLWRAADFPVLSRRPAKILTALVSIPLVAFFLWVLGSSLVWQNDIRIRMGMEEAEALNLATILLLAAATFAIAFAVGRLVVALFRLIRARLLRVMPARRANVLGFVLVVLILVVITRDGIVDRVVRGLDESFELAQALFDTAPPAPIDDRFTGSPASAVDWKAMGQPGRDFVTGGPDAAAISAFTRRPALDPIRVYVGRANAETPEARAKLALAELIRLDAFDREILIVASPTGTGWMDPGSHDPVEYMHGGDIATVAVQYSYMQSPFALVFETRTGLDQASATVSTIHDYWRRLPDETRPRLYIHGLSLGAWSSMYATTLFQLVNAPIAGAFWAGPPFPSDFWNRAQQTRVEGSLWVKPVIRDGSLIRYATRGNDGSEGAADWGPMRIMFLQYPSDAITFFEPLSTFRAPVWMREPPGDGVSPYLRFVPIVTQLQLALDMALATTVPGGYGHSYYAQDYIGPWVSVTAPEGWSEADTLRLKAHCDNGFQNGCTNQ